MEKSLDEQIKEIVKMVEAAGGAALVDPNAPDHLKRAFIETVMNCPDCQKQFAANQTKEK